MFWNKTHLHLAVTYWKYVRNLVWEACFDINPSQTDQLTVTCLNPYQESGMGTLFQNKPHINLRWIYCVTFLKPYQEFVREASCKCLLNTSLEKIQDITE